ncbi:MAG: hypothetical protein R6X12_01850 [bacterium]
MTLRIVVAVALAGAVAIGGVQVRTNGALYPWFRFDGAMNSFMLMGAELDVQATVTSATRDLFSVALQLNAGTAMPGWTSSFHFGEAYAVIPLGLSRPSVRVGQAVIPFGLMADYDVHNQIIQTSFARTVGLRLDAGIGILGTLGPTGYWLQVSNGSGPFAMDGDRDKVITTRIAPTFLAGDAELTVGLSGLVGVLPYWPMDSLPRMADGPTAFARKFRLGLDNTTDWGPVTLRLEGVAGRDSSLAGPAGFGYYAEARWALGWPVELIAKYDGWHQQEAGAWRSARSLGLGTTLRLPELTGLDLQVVYDHEFGKIGGHGGHGGNDGQDWSASTQLTVLF